MATEGNCFNLFYRIQYTIEINYKNTIYTMRVKIQLQYCCSTFLYIVFSEVNHSLSTKNQLLPNPL